MPNRTVLPVAAIVLVLGMPAVLLGSLASEQSHGVESADSSRPPPWRPAGLDGVSQRVRGLDRMIYRVGFALTPGPFHRLVEEATRTGTVGAFKQLLSDPSPLVRLFALLALAQSSDRETVTKAAAVLHDDAAVVMYTNGCVIDQRATVGELARLISNGSF